MPVITVEGVEYTYADRALMGVSAAPGTSTFSLAGTAPGARTFEDAGVLTGANVRYVAESNFDAYGRAQLWEIGLGVYTKTTAAETLTRSTIHASSNGGALVPFGADVQVSLAFTAEDIVTVNNDVLSLTPGAIPYGAVPSGLTADASNFSWDAVNKRLGIGTAAPEATLHFANSALAPIATFGSSGVGTGSITLRVTRSGGAPQFGNFYQNYLATAPVATGLFDVSLTSLASYANVTGGNGFGSWFGANSPAAYLGQAFSGGGIIAMELNAGNRWGDFGLLTDVSVPRYTAALKLVPDVLPAQDGVNRTPVSISLGSPATVTVVGHGYTANMAVVFNENGGTLPPEIVAGAVYYVSAAGLTVDEFQVSATIGGSSINTSAASSGATQIIPSYPGSFAEILGKSNKGHNWHIGRLQRQDAVTAGGYVDYAWGGSVPSSAPGGYALIRGQWQVGLDFTLATFNSSSTAIKLTTNQFFKWGAAYVGQGATAGALALSSGGTANLGLFVNGGAAQAVGANWSGTAVRLGFFSAASSPVIQPAGYGTVVGAAKIVDFDAGTATLAQTAGQLAALIADLKALGVIGN